MNAWVVVDQYFSRVNLGSVMLLQPCMLLYHTSSRPHSVIMFQMSGDDAGRSHVDQNDMDSSANKPVFLVPTDSPGRR